MKFFFLIILSFIFLIPAVYAEIQYPVQELGNCASQQDCEIYCNNAQHMEACINFAEKEGMMTQEEIAEARKVLPFMLSGETPGGCQGKTECDAFCNKDENFQECIDFAEKAGLISGDELALVKKTGGKGPGGCQGKTECDAFCNDESHFSECVDFAVANGLMPASEAEIAKKTGGKGPGNCKSKEECDAYCNVEANFPTCVDFAVANGLMDEKDAEMAKKTGGKGPGGCKNMEECDAFCKNSDNRETCDSFAIEHELGSSEQIEGMKKNQEFMNSGEGKCLMQCLKDAGLDSKSCGQDGAGPEACKTCDDKCFNHDNKKCLNEERWHQLDDECKAKGSGYHLEEVKGDDGYGKECVVDETCVYGSGDEWENQAEKDRKLAEMEAQWERERAEHEAQYGPGTQGTEVYTGGGCTQPGPEGQCNPGPGAGSDGEESGESSGEENEGSSGGSETGDNNEISSGNSEGSSGSESEGDSGGDAGITGEVIMTSNSNGIFTRLIEDIRNLF